MEPASTRRGAWAALALLTAIYALNFADRQLVSIALGPIQRELGASDAQMGWLTGTAFALFYSVAGIPLARLADRGHRWRLLAAGLALWSALTSLSGAARSFTSLALARVGVGIGEAACTPPAHALISGLFAPAKRATAIAIYSAGIYAGFYLAYDVGGWICERWGWREAFVVFGAPGVVLALVAWFVPREPRVASTAPSAPRPALADLRALLAVPAFRHVALGAGIKSIAGYGLAAWVPTFLERVHAMGSREAGAWLGPIFGLGGALGTLAGGWLADRLGRERPSRRLQLSAVATLLALPFLYAFLFVPDSRTALAFYAPASILGAMYLGPAFALAQDLVRAEQRALASATLLFLVNLIGLGVGPWLVGASSDALAARFGPESLRWALAIVAVSYAWGALHMLRAAAFTARSGSPGASPAART